ncbi:MAG: exonuclease SbcCD subunit D [Faecousia sp.]
MIKILHGADFHLDSTFSALSAEQAAQRRQEQRSALEQLASLCDGCDLVFLAGDLFDSAHIYRDTLDALKRFFSAVKAEVFIAPGNHDFVSGGSPYLAENWGENVHIFTKPTIERVRLERLHCDVYGAAFTAREMPPLLENFRVTDPEALNLMVLHGELQPNSVYNAITPAQVENSGLDYLALGHNHLGQTRQFGRTLCAWPGCLMGRGFDECGQKGVLRVEAEKGACRAEFVPVLTRKYEILKVPAEDDPLKSIREALPEGAARDCIRVILTGEAETIDLPALEEALRGSCYSLSLRDATEPKQELWSACGSDTLRGQFLRNLKEQYDRSGEAERRKIVLAAQLVTALMDGREAPL